MTKSFETRETELYKENQRLRAALEFYADENTYRGSWNGTDLISGDWGAVARAALKEEQ